MAVYEGSEIFVELLNANGVEDVFYNPGFDVVPLLSAIARYKAAGKAAPATIMCLDEFTAMNAAHGNYMISGRPQVVLVHAELGTQQVGGAIQQAWWGRVPLVLCAANMVSLGRLNWRKEPYDSGAMVRNCVKWDHEVGKDESFYEALNHAFQAADSDPKGPVYLCYPIDALQKKVEIETINAAVRSILPEANPAALKSAAALLLQAENPLIMTGYSGRDQRTVSSLIELAEIIGARVVTSPIRMNFPSSHPLCANLEPTDGMQTKPYFLSSDVVLVIDYDIPYAYPARQPNPGTKIIHIDLDFAKQGEPLWNKQADIPVKADSAKAIPALTATIRPRITAEQRRRIQERSQKIHDENLKVREDYLALGKSAGDKKPISPEWLAYCINQVIDEDTILVNQTIMPSASVARQIPRTRPGTLVACAGGTIGWALGAALGAKLAAPEKLVVSLMGDGAFVYGGPTATLWPAANYKAPFLSVIFNNQAYGAIKMLFQGAWKEGIKDSLILPSPDYATTAQGCGAYGRKVEEPQEVLPALKEAVARVRQGKAAVLDVRLG
jgi:acetolactate synthase-1/2/3 large subunit